MRSPSICSNVKPLSAYYEAIDRGEFPIERGYPLDADDRLRRFVITELMCNFRVRQADLSEHFGVTLTRYFAVELDQLVHGPVADGFLRVTSDGLEVTADGRLFVRNIAMHFDRYLRRKTRGGPAFSRTIWRIYLQTPQMTQMCRFERPAPVARSNFTNRRTLTTRRDPSAKSA